MDALFLVLKKVLKQHHIFLQHAHRAVARNILMKKIVTVVVFRHSEIKHNLLLASYYQALTFLHQNSSFRTETTITIL